MTGPILSLAIALLGAATTAGDDTPPLGGFIRVSPRDSRYLETDDGKPFIPIGMNLIAPPDVPGDDPDARLEALDDWLVKLSAHGGNFFRVWLSNDFYEVEHDKAGAFDPERAERIERMLQLARKHRLRVKLTVEHFREIDPANPGKTWALNTRLHTTRGGPASSMNDWLSRPEARRLFVEKLSFLTDRFRDDPTVFGWELWNEMNAVRGEGPAVMDWTAAMLPELRRLAPSQLVMQSYGSFDNEAGRAAYQAMVRLPGNDLAQVHRYLDLGAKLQVCHGPVDVLAADAVRELRAVNPGKPILLAESGAVEPGHSGPFKLYAKDREGIILHDVLFAPFFAGAAGSGQCWHWDRYIAANNLWGQFACFSAAVAGIDPPAERFEPEMIDHPAFRAYFLRGGVTSLAWLRDRSSDWNTELAEGRAPSPITGQVLDLNRLSTRPRGTRARIYDPWAGRWTERPVPADGRLALPDFTRSLVVRIQP